MVTFIITKARNQLNVGRCLWVNLAELVCDKYQGELTRGDTEGIEHDVNSNGNEFLGFGNLGALSNSAVVATTSQLDMIASIDWRSPPWRSNAPSLRG